MITAAGRVRERDASQNHAADGFTVAMVGACWPMKRLQEKGQQE